MLVATVLREGLLAIHGLSQSRTERTLIHVCALNRLRSMNGAQDYHDLGGSLRGLGRDESGEGVLHMNAARKPANLFVGGIAEQTP